jgi:hypothetical protein
MKRYLLLRLLSGEKRSAPSCAITRQISPPWTCSLFRPLALMPSGRSDGGATACKLVVARCRSPAYGGRPASRQASVHGLVQVGRMREGSSAEPSRALKDGCSVAPAWERLSLPPVSSLGPMWLCRVGERLCDVAGAVDEALDHSVSLSRVPRWKSHKCEGAEDREPVRGTCAPSRIPVTGHSGRPDRLLTGLVLDSREKPTHHSHWQPVL